MVPAWSHKPNHVSSSLTSATKIILYMKKLDIIKAPSLELLILELNKLGVQKENIVQFIPPNEKSINYLCIFYYEQTTN